MKEKIGRLLLLLTLVATAGVAQTWRGDQTVALHVNDSKGRPVPDARVVFTFQGVPNETGPGVVATDGKGWAVLANLAAGPWQVEVSHPDYLSYIAMVDVRRGKKPLISASFLEAGGRSLSPVKVKFSKGNPQQASPILEARQPVEPRAPVTSVSEAPVETAPRTAETEPPVASPPPPVSTEPLPITAPSASQETQPVEPATETTETRAKVPEPSPEPVEVASDPVPEVEDPPQPAEPARPVPEPESPQPVVEAPAPPPVETPQPEPEALSTPVEVAPAPEIELMVEEPEMEEVEEPEPPIVVETPPVVVEATVSEPEPASQPVEVQPVEPTPAAAAETVEPAVQMPLAEEPVPEPTAEDLIPPATEPPAVEPTLIPAVPPVSEIEPIAEPEPPVPAATAPAVAAGSIPPPADPGLQINSHRDGSCPDCESAEWTLQVSVGVPAMETGSTGTCGREVIDSARAAMQELGSSIQLELDGFIGPVANGTSREAVRRVEPDLAEPFSGRLAAFVSGASPCQIVGLILPKAVRFSRVRLAAADEANVGNCPPGQSCAIGDSAWLGSALVERGSSATVVWGLFENRSTQYGRRAYLTAYYRPPNANWKPRLPSGD